MLIVEDEGLIANNIAGTLEVDEHLAVISMKARRWGSLVFKATTWNTWERCSIR
jgi:hypothetical protein